MLLTNYTTNFTSSYTWNYTLHLTELQIRSFIKVRFFYIHYFLFNHVSLILELWIDNRTICYIFIKSFNLSLVLAFFHWSFLNIFISCCFTSIFVLRWSLNKPRNLLIIYLIWNLSFVSISWLLLNLELSSIIFTLFQKFFELFDSNIFLSDLLFNSCKLFFSFILLFFWYLKTFIKLIYFISIDDCTLILRRLQLLLLLIL